MGPVLETLLLFIVKQLVTPELIKQGETALVKYLQTLAADSSNKIDDYMVQVIADALGVTV